MGTIREYGYREYADGLTPGKEGRSNLLFNKEGDLSGHAEFHRTSAEPAEDASIDDPVDTLKVVAVVGAVAVGVAVAIRRVTRAMRARRSATAESGGQCDQPTLAEAEDGTSLESAEADPQEELIREVESLTRNPVAKTPGPPGRSLAEESESDTPANTSRTRHRRIRGH